MDPIFGITTNCCGTDVTPGQEIIAQYYEEASPWIFNLMDQAFAAAIYGKDPQVYYNRTNDFHYLLALMLIIRKRRLEYVALNGVDQTVDYWYETYNLACITRTFMCKGYDIAPLLDIFGLNPISGRPVLGGINTSPCPPALDGIDYMHIESGPLCEPIFIVG